MTLIENSIALLNQRGEIAKKKLGSRITSDIIDTQVTEMINQILMLLVIRDVRLN